MSIEQSVTDRGAVDQWRWRIHTQSVDTTQNVAEHRLVAAFGPPIETNRNGELTFEQETFSAELNGLVETGTDDSFSTAFYFGASLEADAVSPKLGAAVELHERMTLTAQYAAGFRAPPYSSINTGFANLAAGYQTIANSGLDPEISDNFELGLRWSSGGTSWSVNGFRNNYDD